MQAIVHNEHGGVGVLRLTEVPDPVSGAGEVVVRVRAAGVNRLDALQRQGPPLIPRFSLPHIPGMDIAGEVAECGAGVDPALIGRRVLVKAGIHCGECVACRAGEDARCTHTRLLGGNAPGGYAELCVVPATHVFPIPDDLSFAEAAAIPTACSTAWRGIVKTAQVSMGETVLIHAAGSGVSTYALQIAARAGAHVIVTSRDDEKLERALELGAHVGINSAKEDVAAGARNATGGRGVDVVFDHVGPALLEASLGSLRHGGRLVVCGTTTGAIVTLSLPRIYHAGLSVLGVPSQSHAEFVDMLDHCWRLGLRSVIDLELPLAEAAAAHERLERNEVVGKIVLTP